MPNLLLHQYPPIPGNVSLSPFCCKVQAALKLRSLDFKTHDTMFAARASEFSQLPLLEWDSEKLNDSSTILRALDNRVPSERPFFPGDPEVNLWEDWADESLYWYGMYAKFHDDEGWARIGPLVVGMLPIPMRVIASPIVRRRMRALLHAHGLLRRDRQNVETELDRHLDMIDKRLESRPYLCGAHPTAADCSVVGILAQPNLADTQFLGKRIAARPRVTEYLTRFRKESKTDV
ncbi:MAG TPA: glutathione S-transferase family protein [Myxococcaceae bacterium]|nr:glutathione S-transferase family protein [Myxococcaceae bacterium]